MMEFVRLEKIIPAIGENNPNVPVTTNQIDLGVSSLELVAVDFMD